MAVQQKNEISILKRQSFQSKNVNQLPEQASGNSTLGYRSAIQNEIHHQ